VSEKEKVTQLLLQVELNIEAGNRKEAEKGLFQALRIAEKIHDEMLASKVLSLLRKIGLFLVNTQYIELSPLETEGFILDIGGGGEGIIGELNGRQVIAIDTSERELAETHNEALKVVMDATDLRFLPKSFDVCTAFFSLMYIPKSKHSTVFRETHRVLRDNGRFLVWDVRIPMAEEECNQFIAPLKIQLPNEVVETGYGVKWQVQDIEYFKQLVQQTKFRVLNEWSKGEIFHLEMRKET